ncbi:enolase-phosphatase E1 [Pieris napi]|uniref:enolase-phosphatase E1 n=1 Tax=Pieris napi TaxID=78633 RepID=UPI001FB8ADFA|nr:enolase-phosphatase E1 [Pieris napi]
MANELKEINDIVKKCKILLLDIEGTTTSISFVKDKLFPYAEENVKTFLDSQWENEDVKMAVTALRKLALEDKEKSVEGVVSIPGEDASKEDQIEGIVNNVKWQMSSDRKVGALKQLQGLIWKQGYDKGDIKGHVYDDVLPGLEQWRAVDGQKVYIYSSGSVQAQKLLFGQSLAGDLLKFIDGHFDTAVGAKQEAASYKAIVEKIGCSAEDVLFLTDVVKEAEAAKSAGLYTALVTREGNAPLTDEDKSSYPVIESFGQLTVSNKRKTDPQDEQPAKVLKTDINDDVKTATESAEEKVASPTEKVAEEKMEVDDSAVEAKSETIIEEITDAKDTDAPVCDIKPIVTEVDDSQEKEEKMETEINGSVAAEKSQAKETSDEKTPKKANELSKDQVVKEDSPVAEETPPAVITEIEEITNEKESLADAAEIIEGLDPVVEEPETEAEIDNLQNVSDELEKECDEILSKMKNVANLENMKPLLKPIIEESMEVENHVPNEGDKVSDTKVESKNDSQPAVSESKEKKDVEEKADESKEPKVLEASEDKSISNEPIAEKAKETNGIDKIAVPTDETEVKQENDSKPTDVVTETKAEKEIVPKNTKETQAEPEKSESNDTKETKGENEVQLNGDATNGTEISQNGVEKVEERLSAENGKEMNGSNGTNETEEEIKSVSEIKVKSLSKEDPLPDPIEQATEA